MNTISAAPPPTYWSLRPSRIVAQLQQTPRLVGLGEYGFGGRRPHRLAKAQASTFGELDEDLTRELVNLLNEQTAKIGRADAIVACAHHPAMNMWGTLIRFTFNETLSTIGGKHTPAQQHRTGRPASPKLIDGAWYGVRENGRRFPIADLVYRHDARVFVNDYRPGRTVQVLNWHQPRQQWEMPYAWNEHLTDSELMHGDSRYQGEWKDAKLIDGRIILPGQSGYEAPESWPRPIRKLGRILPPTPARQRTEARDVAQ